MASSEIVVSVYDFWTFMLCTFRYALGRSTYIVDECIHLYEMYSENLALWQKAQLVKEIEEALAAAEARKGTVGMVMDHAGWRKLAVRIRSEGVQVS